MCEREREPSSLFNHSMQAITHLPEVLSAELLEVGRLGSGIRAREGIRVPLRAVVASIRQVAAGGLQSV